MKTTPSEYMQKIMQSDEKTGAATPQNENRHAEFMARELDKIIPPQQPQESK